MCKRYGWPHNFWHTMGRREFYAWVGQTERDVFGEESDPDTWEGSERDPGWAEMRRKREEFYGRG